MPTPINQAAVAALIERRNLVLNNYNDSPSQHRSLLIELGVLNDAIAFYAPEYSASSGSLSVGAATDATIVSSTATLKTAIDNIHTLIGNTVSFAETVWIDTTDTVYIRIREADGDISYMLADGTAYVPVGASTLASLSKEDLEIDITEYDAKTSGTEWSIGQRISRLQYLDLSATPALIKATVWRNEATGAIITTAISIVTDLEIPPDRSFTKLDKIDTAFGAPADAAATSDTGSFGIIPLFKRLLGKQPVLGTAGTPSADVITVQGSSTGTQLPVVSQLNIPSPIVDVPSAAISTAATSAVVTPSSGISQIFTISVTGVTGTATLAVTVEESDDSDIALWRPIYTFPMISAVGSYRSPAIDLSGNRIRYAQTIGGTGTITRQIVRVQSNHPAQDTLRTDISIPVTINDPASVKGLLRFLHNSILGRLLQGSQAIAQSLAVNLARKTTIVGAITTGAANTNLLDPTGAGNWTDVRDYGSAELTFVSTVGSFVFGAGLETSIDALGTHIGFSLAAYDSASGLPSTITGIGANTVLRQKYDLLGVNYVRLRSTNTIAGNRVYATFSQLPAVNRVLAVINSLPIVSVNSVASARLASNTSAVAISGTITASTTSGTVSQTWGNSRLIEIGLTTLSPNTTLTLEVQEPIGASWRTVYKFAPITAVGSWRSPPLTNSSSTWRYVETFSGTANNPSATRTITHTESNVNVSAIVVSQQLGGFNVTDLAIFGKVRQVVANNQSTVNLFLQVHNKATALAQGDTPNSKVFPIVPGGVVALTAADLGEFGSLWGTTPRIAISTTFSTYTAPVLVAPPNQTFALNVEVV